MKDCLKFDSMTEFYNKRTTIREKYQTMIKKREYKEYVYSKKSITPQYLLDIIWEYLNEPKGSPYYVFEKNLRDRLERRYYVREIENKNEK